MVTAVVSFVALAARPAPSPATITPRAPAATIPSTAQPFVAFDICIQDDANPARSLAFSSTTGAYTYCCGNTTFSGTGLVKVKGQVVSLVHYPPDHKLVATVNQANHRGTASLQFPHATVPCTIIDRNTANSTCPCVE